MKTVTICGSMRFAAEMRRIAFLLESRHEMNVLQCVYTADGEPVSEDGRRALAEAHRQKIHLSDAIYVVDIQGYIGASTRAEMAYAEALGKEIILHSAYQP